MTPRGPSRASTMCSRGRCRAISAITAKLARMARKIEVARLLCWRAATLADVEQPNQIEASMAKAFAPAAAQEVTSLALEILGEAGGAAGSLRREALPPT